MRAITAAMAALGVFGALACTAPARARADWDDYDGGWRRQEWHKHQWRDHQLQEQHWHEGRERAWKAYAPPLVAYAPPGYYAPPPPTYYLPPVAYYAPSPPVHHVPTSRPVFVIPGF